MNVEVNWLAIVLATLSTMVVGSVWYSLGVFGKTWEKLTGLDKKKDRQRSDAVGPIITTLVVSFVTAFVLAHMVYLAHKFYGNSFLYDSVMTSFWVWLGFTATRFITHDAFEGRRQKLTVLNISHELVTFLVMGLIIGLMGV